MKLEQARQFALSLPETTEEPHFNYTSFRVKGKIFATAPPGGGHLNIFVDEELRDPLIASDPEIYAPLPWGARVVGVQVTLAKANPTTVKRLLAACWTRKAPKRLAADTKLALD